jgi:hypothetical protein
MAINKGSLPEFPPGIEYCASEFKYTQIKAICGRCWNRDPVVRPKITILKASLSSLLLSVEVNALSFPSLSTEDDGNSPSVETPFPENSASDADSSSESSEDTEKRCFEEPDAHLSVQSEKYEALQEITSISQNCEASISRLVPKLPLSQTFSTSLSTTNPPTPIFPPFSCPLPDTAAAVALPPTPVASTVRHSHQSSPNPSVRLRQANLNRLRSQMIIPKSLLIPVIHRDRFTGKPMLPLNIGKITILNLGQIRLHHLFHTERYIFPVGYEITQQYLSTQDAYSEAAYYCKILDGGDRPRFQITAQDRPGVSFEANTPTGAWASVVRSARLLRRQQHASLVSGTNGFGLDNSIVRHLIQELPKADKLQKYERQKFVESE